jgi:hypothetical protein
MISNPRSYCQIIVQIEWEKEREKLLDYYNIGECFELKEEYYKKANAAYKNIYPTIYGKPRS